MSEPAAPPADDKDWTWVLDRPCAECGFDASTVTTGTVEPRIRAAVAALQAPLTGAEPGRRPEPETWSPLEYACHVRDVCIVFGARLAQMRHSDDPLFANWDQDATALEDRYWEQAPDRVSADLGVEGDRLATAFGSVEAAEWPRPGRRSNGSVFTVDTLARYLLHDLEHHAHDVAGTA